ncbi:hypothetical protein EXIGLDRAFT_647485 [Exidia glandulosa HHB12029]|uniref:Zn(2)-C6 fungal-type domain-containing protein n=1 Tax=Exidia glandulosa HHB12029 TaxID=1314781 RepID=A0A165HN66_EXIGL|nr:hypothetical protein EXIGLDRAFT_647485 [Exidia glandulosa HHB12029]
MERAGSSSLSLPYAHTAALNAAAHGQAQQQIPGFLLPQHLRQSAAPVTPSTGSEDEGNGGKKQSKGKRKKVNHACLYCRRSHMTCDDGRPCQRCIKREIGHLCHDDYKPSTRAKSPDGTSQPQSASGSATPQTATPSHPQLQRSESIDQIPPFTPQAPINYVMPAVPLQQPAQPPPTTTQWPLYPSQLGAAAGMHLEGFGNEFADLTSILDNLDDPFFFNTPSFAQYPSQMPMHPAPPEHSESAPSTSSVTLDTPALDPTSPARAPEEPVLPSANKTEQFLLAAADLPTGTRNERLSRVIHAKYEAGLLKPYNYATGYARLSRWMDRSLSQKARQQILQPLGVLRPKFREVAGSLTDMDLVLIEEAFERLLLDYDRVFSVMGVPACLWRRTGEIYKGNREFAELVGVEGHMLRDGRLCIYELMAEESAVNYWQKFGQVAFDTEHKAVLTSCVLRYQPTTSPQGHVVSHVQQAPPVTPALSHAFGPSMPATPRSVGLPLLNMREMKKEDRFIHCCCSFTIRRDDKGIPSMIVGNFIKY